MPRVTVTDPIKVFGKLNERQIGNSIRHLFSFLVQRGCVQHCVGCHAGSYRTTTDASWDHAKKLTLGIEAAMKKLNVEPERQLVELFRDGDPSWIKFPDQPKRGIGDLADMLYHRLGKRSKVMTSGAPFDAVDRTLAQYAKGAPHFSSTSVSASIQTANFMRDPDTDVQVRARLLDNFIEHSPPETPAYLDFMFFTPDGRDPQTRKTLQLVRKIAHHSRLFPKSLLEIDFDEIDGRTNQKFMAGDVGIRISPYLALTTYGRGMIRNGQKLESVGITDWLSVLDGRDCVLQVGDETFTRREVREDHDRRSFLIEGLRGVSAANNWLIGSEAVPELDEFFMTEFDVTPAIETESQRISLFYQGLTLGPKINFLVSNPARGELQEVLPWVKLDL